MANRLTMALRQTIMTLAKQGRRVTPPSQQSLTQNQHYRTL